MTDEPRVSRRYVGGPKDGVEGNIDPRVGLITMKSHKDGEYVLTRLHPSNAEVQFDPNAGYIDPAQPDDAFFFQWHEVGWTDPKMPPIRGAWTLDQ